jgi:hypothetical protein
VAENYSMWFQQQLQASADGFAWAVMQVPAARQFSRPPQALGEWTAVRHLFHMLDYEREIALPVMRQWLGAPEFAVNWDEEAGWRANCDVALEHLLDQFRAVRSEQIALLSQFPEHAWHDLQMTGWGPIPLLWLVSKTYQHTNEHTSSVLQMALFWDYYARQEQADVGVDKG